MKGERAERRGIEGERLCEKERGERERKGVREKKRAQWGKERKQRERERTRQRQSAMKGVCVCRGGMGGV